MTTLYTTYAEAETVRKRKQKQFPNFYVRIKKVKSGKKIKYRIVVSFGL